MFLLIKSKELGIGKYVSNVTPQGTVDTLILYHSFRYQAASWKVPRRVVAKIEWHR